MLYATLLKASGLSQREAATFHGVRPDTVKSWSAGRNPAPDGAIDELAGLIDLMAHEVDRYLEKAFQAVENHKLEAVELGVASDDIEAQARGWPAASVQRMVTGITAGQLIAEGINVEIVPRGATVATAAAIDQIEKRKK